MFGGQYFFDHADILNKSSVITAQKAQTSDAVANGDLISSLF